MKVSFAKEQNSIHIFAFMYIMIMNTSRWTFEIHRPCFNIHILLSLVFTSELWHMVCISLTLKFNYINICFHWTKPQPCEITRNMQNYIAYVSPDSDMTLIFSMILNLYFNTIYDIDICTEIKPRKTVCTIVVGMLEKAFCPLLSYYPYFCPENLSYNSLS